MLTVEMGYVLQSAVRGYDSKTGRYPTLSELASMSEGFYRDASPPIASAIIKPAVVTNVNGTGGWAYDSRNGVLALNMTQTFVLDEHCRVDLQRITFARPPRVPGCELKDLNLADRDFAELDKIVDRGVTSYLRDGKVSFQQ